MRMTRTEKVYWARRTVRLLVWQQCTMPLTKLCTMHLELKRRGEDVPEWSYEIPKDTLLQAKVLMDYFINQKFAMLRQGCANGGPTELEKYDWHRLRRILELQSVAVTPSMISQAHIQIRTADGRYHRDDAIKLMEDLRSLNLVELDLRGGRGRPTTVLRKRRIDDLSEDEKDIPSWRRSRWIRTSIHCIDNITREFCMSYSYTFMPNFMH